MENKIRNEFRKYIDNQLADECDSDSPWYSFFPKLFKFKIAFKYPFFQKERQ